MTNPYLNSTLQSTEDCLNKLYPNRKIRIVPAVGGFMIFAVSENQREMVSTFVDQTVLDHDEGLEPFYIATAQILGVEYLLP